MRKLTIALLVLLQACGAQEGDTGGMDMDGQAMDMNMEGAATETDGPAMEGMVMEGMGRAEGAVRLTAEEIRRSGITFGDVRIREMERTIRAVGVVDFDETRMAYVAPKFGGWAERLEADFTGQSVTRGQTLAHVYSPEVVAAQEELLLARDLAEDLLASARRRLEYWDVPAAFIDGVLETGEVRRTVPVEAPLSGVVMEKNVFPGQAFQPGTNLYMIADLSRVWVNAEVFESDAPLLRAGMGVDVTLAALPGRVFRGVLDFVHPSLRDDTRSLRARITLVNPEGLLKPGMYATVTVTVPLGRALTVPAGAILHTGERDVVFVARGGGRMEPREVTPGRRGGDFVQVLDGLEEGLRVVTSAQFILDAESNVAEVMRAMMAQMNVTDMQDMDMDMDMDMDTGSAPDTAGGGAPPDGGSRPQQEG